MSVSMTILADRPALVADVYNLLAEHLQTVAIEGDDVLFKFVIGDVAVEEALAEENEATRADEEIVEPTPAAVTLISTEAQAAAIRQHNGTEPSATDRIVELLTQHPDRTFTAAQVAEHLPDINAGSISALLNQAMGRSRIAKVDRGQYQALDRTAVHDARRRAAAEAM